MSATGAILQTGYLFWDEPEANLNPRMVARLAATIVDLGGHGVQVFIATHSLFLLRELEMLLSERDDKEYEARFFGLHAGPAGVTVEQGTTIDDIGDIGSLDEELAQSDRYMSSGL